MKERPIIFSTPMVKAILDGRKTMTRRVIKFPKWMQQYAPDFSNAYADGGVFAPGAYLKIPLTSGDMKGTVQRVFCPYGYPYKEGYLTEESTTRISSGLEQINMRPMEPRDGDRLWVRETWRILDNTIVLDNEVRIEYKADGQIIKRRYGDIAWNEGGLDLPIIESAMKDGKWKPAHHLPHIISRITLEITEVRVERLQEITEEDAEREGCTLMAGVTSGGNMGLASPRYSFMKLWDSLNAKRGYSWESNLWVWVIKFGAMGYRLK